MATPVAKPVPAGSTAGTSPTTMSEESANPLADLPLTQTINTVSDVPDWYKPYLLHYFSAMQPIMSQALGMYPLPDQRVAAFSPYQQAGQNASAVVAGQNAPLTTASSDLAFRTMRGDYLYPGSNPYLDATYNQAARGVADQYKYATAPSNQAEAYRQGAFGGSAQNQWRNLQEYGLGQNLNNLATDIYGGNYQAERSRQADTQGNIANTLNANYVDPNQMMNVGAQQQALSQLGMTTQYQNQTQRAMWPFTVLNQWKTGLNTGVDIGGTKSTTQPTEFALNPLSTLLGLWMMQQQR